LHDELIDVYISSLMPVKRFSWILSNIHANDNSVIPGKGHPNFDKLYRIRPVINFLLETFKENYAPTREQAIDGRMIKFKGIIGFKQYMPQKPVKRGYKIWVWVDKTGYVCDIQIYTGKIVDKAEKNLGERVVQDLCQGLEGKVTIYTSTIFSQVYP
jgi:hypothetical protein